jgi:hypothetical protein
VRQNERLDRVTEELYDLVKLSLFPKGEKDEAECIN